MKKQSRKLNLNRETLIPLQTSELDAINGGIIPLTSQISLPTATRILCPSLPSTITTGISIQASK